MESLSSDEICQIPSKTWYAQRKTYSLAYRRPAAFFLDRAIVDKTVQVAVPSAIRYLAAKDVICTEQDKYRHTHLQAKCSTRVL